MAAELSPDDPDAVTVIATGGLAPLVIDEVKIIDAYEPWLTLIGLRLVWERNLTAYPPLDAASDEQLVGAMSLPEATTGRPRWPRAGANLESLAGAARR